jgi:hypothetical protein
MQGVDRIADVEALTQPAKARRSHVDSHASRLVLFPYGLNRVSGNRWSRRYVGEDETVWSAESQLAVAQSLDLKSFLMDGAVVATTQYREIR